MSFRNYVLNQYRVVAQRKSAWFGTKRPRFQNSPTLQKIAGKKLSNVMRLITS